MSFKFYDLDGKLMQEELRSENKTITILYDKNGNICAKLFRQNRPFISKIIVYNQKHKGPVSTSDTKYSSDGAKRKIVHTTYGQKDFAYEFSDSKTLLSKF